MLQLFTALQMCLSDHYQFQCKMVAGTNRIHLETILYPAHWRKPTWICYDNKPLEHPGAVGPTGCDREEILTSVLGYEESVAQKLLQDGVVRQDYWVDCKNWSVSIVFWEVSVLKFKLKYHNYTPNPWNTLVLWGRTSVTARRSALQSLALKRVSPWTF